MLESLPSDTFRFMDLVLSALPSLVSYLSTDRKYLFVNPAYERWFGIPREECLGKTIDFILGEAAMKTLNPFLEAAFKGEAQKFERLVPYRLGGMRFIEVNYLPDRGEDGVVRGLVIIVNDITEHKSREEKLRLIIETMDDGLVLQDSDAKIIQFNQAAVEILGLTSDQLLGKSSYDPHWKTIREDGSPFPGEEHPAVQVLKTGKKVLNTVMGVQLPGGEKRWLRINATPYNSKDFSSVDLKSAEQRNVLVTFSNITNELKAKETLELERAKMIQNAKLVSLGEMSAGIAHEINNPLAIITGALDLLPGVKNDEEKFNQKVEMLQKASERIAKIVRGLRRFSRTAGDSIHHAVSVSSLIKESVVLTEAKVKGSSVTLTSDIRSDATILCDEVEIEQVIINLINNAVDAAKNEESKWVKILLFEEQNELILQVVDSGKGIQKKVKDRLFQPFFTTKPIGEGTGLGLSISKVILDQHKAKIEVMLLDGHTCFQVRFLKNS